MSCPNCPPESAPGPVLTLDEQKTQATIVLVGNPNVGKSTIFNHVTGARQRVVNAPGTTVQVMSGGQSASVALMMKNQMSLLQYPAAAANAVVLLVLVLLMVAGILRIVDIRKEL